MESVVDVMKPHHHVYVSRYLPVPPAEFGTCRICGTDCRSSKLGVVLVFLVSVRLGEVVWQPSSTEDKPYDWSYELKSISLLDWSIIDSGINLLHDYLFYI